MAITGAFNTAAEATVSVGVASIGGVVTVAGATERMVHTEIDEIHPDESWTTVNCGGIPTGTQSSSMVFGGPESKRVQSPALAGEHPPEEGREWRQLRIGDHMS